MRLKTLCLGLAALPLLAACVNDSVSYRIEGRSQALTLVREQRWLWDKKVDLALVVARMPECQRRHSLGPGSPREVIEVWQPGPGTFIIRRSSGMVLTETQTCESWQKLDAEPPGGLGDPIGAFRQVDGVLKFVSAAEAAPAQ